MTNNIVNENAITILIPTYNCVDYITRCISSITNQNIDSNLLKVIIYDDDSTDGTIEAAQVFVNKYPQQIRLCTKSNLHISEKLGINLARKKLIELCTTKYLIFLDADDWFLPKSLNRYIKKAQKGIYEIVFARSIRYSYERTRKEVKKGKRWFLTKHQGYHPKNGLNHLLSNFPYVWATLFNKEFLVNSNFEYLPHKDFFEDFCFVNYILPRAKITSVIKKPCHAYLNTWTSPANPTVQARTLPQKNFAMAFEFFEHLMNMIIKNKYEEMLGKKKYKAYINNITFTLAMYYVGIFFSVDKKFYQLFAHKFNRDENLWERIVSGYKYELQKYNLKMGSPKKFYKKIAYWLEAHWRFKKGEPIKFIAEENKQVGINK